MESEIKKRLNQNGLIISRIPSWTKEIIIEKANEEFCGDYGMCVAQIVREANEYNCLKTKFFNSELGVKLITDKHNEEKPSNEIKMANGKVIKGGDAK